MYFCLHTIVLENEFNWTVFTTAFYLNKSIIITAIIITAIIITPFEYTRLS